MSKVIYVFGPQHSGTRLFSCLIDRHPDVKGILHQSFPCGKDQYYDNFSTSNQYDFDNCDYLVIVNRENEFINKSNMRGGLGKIAEKSKIHIMNELENIKIKNEDFYKIKVIDVSYEKLVSQKELYVKQILESMNLDTSKYDFNLKGKIHTPNNQFGEQNNNAMCILKIMDGNAKYRN